MAPVYSDLVDLLRPKIEAITTGNQLDEKVKMGPDDPRIRREAAWNSGSARPWRRCGAW